jgi:hypothetical protein
MTVSAVWHGVYIGYYLCLMSAPMYLPVEDVYVEIRGDATGLVGISFIYRNKLDSQNGVVGRCMVSSFFKVLEVVQREL